MSKYKNLFSPIRIGSQMIKNRIIMPAMDTGLCNADGTVSPALVAHYARRAQGGVGLIISEFTSVDYPAGRGAVTQLQISQDEVIPGFRMIADAVHAYGAKMLVQLHHAGARSNQFPGIRLVAPSDGMAGKQEVHGMTVEECRELIGKFVKAAQRAQKASMDGIEIHAGHGYLVGQFLSSQTNTRDDEFGGDTKRRCQFLVEIIRGIREACGKNFIISVRLAVKDRHPTEGLQLEEGIEIAKIIDAEPVDLINLTTGVKYKWIGALETQERPDGDRVFLAEAVKPHVKHPIAIVGKLRKGEMCEKIIADGTADMVCVGRPQICDPDWVNKVRYGKEDEIRTCLNCMYGCYGAISRQSGIRCVINPHVGFDDVYPDGDLPKAARPGKVVVVGGGVAGMQAAWTAAQRGHSVTLFEKSDKLGGQALIASIPPYKETLALIPDFYAKQMAKEGVEVRLNAEADVDTIAAMNPDKVIIATGSKPVRPPVEGIEKAVESWDVLTGSDKPQGKNVVIIGGGLVGCETALHLLEYGNKITIIEMLATLANGQEASHRARDLDTLKNGGVVMNTLASVKKVTDTAVEFVDSEGNAQSVPADLVIVATGQRPVGGELFAALEEKGIRVEKAGDAVAMGNFLSNVQSGFAAGYAK